jgi:hypothetical protein
MIGKEGGMSKITQVNMFRALRDWKIQEPVRGGGGSDLDFKSELFFGPPLPQRHETSFPNPSSPSAHFIPCARG